MYRHSLGHSNDDFYKLDHVHNFHHIDKFDDLDLFLPHHDQLDDDDNQSFDKPSPSAHSGGEATNAGG